MSLLHYLYLCMAVFFLIGVVIGVMAAAVVGFQNSSFTSSHSRRTPLERLDSFFLLLLRSFFYFFFTVLQSTWNLYIDDVT